MTAKLLAATQNISANKQNQLKITKETLISKLCCSCVRLLVHRFIFSMLLGKYSRYMLSKKIFFQIQFVWQENDLVFSSEFEKNSITKNNNIKIAPPPPPPPPPPHTHTQHKLKLSTLSFQYLGHRERVHRYFIKQ